MSHDPLLDGEDEREWAAQERARIAVQDGAPVAEDDADARRYRIVARGLAALSRFELPAGFAETVARRVASRVAEPALSPFERAAVAVLIVAFAAAALIAVAAFGLAAPVADALRGGASFAANRWMLALAACLAASALAAGIRVPMRR